MTDKGKMVFGFALLIVVFLLAVVIALGKVEEHTSYGLPFVLGSLSTLSGGFAAWAFGKDNTPNPNSKPPLLSYFPHPSDGEIESILKKTKLDCPTKIDKE